MATRMQQRRGTAAEWAASNPILAAGEIGFETDTKILKLGDGVTTWSQLSSGLVSTRGGNTIEGVDPASVPLILKGAAGQTADIWRAETSGGTGVRVDNSGEIYKGANRLASVADLAGYLAVGAKAADSNLLDGLDSTAFAKLTGAAFSGSVDAKNGFDVRRSGTSKPASDLPSTYPEGLSSWNVTLANGWPTSGVCITEVLTGSAYTVQIVLAYSDAGTVHYRARPVSSTDAWGAWKTLLKTGDKAGDSDLLGGAEASEGYTNGTIVKRTGSGYINAVLFASSYASTNSSIEHIMTRRSTDDYLRPSTPAQLSTALGLPATIPLVQAGVTVSGNAVTVTFSTAYSVAPSMSVMPQNAGHTVGTCTSVSTTAATVTALASNLGTVSCIKHWSATERTQ